jgi:hypothetical protein
MMILQETLRKSSRLSKIATPTRKRKEEEDDVVPFIDKRGRVAADELTHTAEPSPCG